jgi:hypothetical protein
MSPIFVAVVIVYLNGEPIDVESLGIRATAAQCEADSKRVIEKLRQDAPTSVQLEIKCLDYGSAPRAAAAFGAR